jgi:hypothetical protein
VINKVEKGRGQIQLRIWSSVKCPGATMWRNLQQQKDPNALVLERKKTTYKDPRPRFWKGKKQHIRTPTPWFWKGKNNI